MAVRFDKILGNLLTKYVKTIGDTMTGTLHVNTSSTSTSILKVTKADGTVVFNIDTTTKTITGSNSLVLGNYASYSDTVISFLSAGNDATITYDESNDEFNIGNAGIYTTGTIQATLLTDGTTTIIGGTINATTIIQNGSTLDSTYVNVSGDTMTGNLTITPDSDDTDVLSVNQSDGTDVFDVDTTNRKIKVTSGTSGQSTIDAGLVVNKESGSDAINDFQVNSDTETAIKVDASEDSLAIGVKTTFEKSLTHALATKTSDYTVTDDDEYILADGSSNTVTITLPTASGITGRVYTIKCIDDTNTVTIDGDGSETIDGDTTVTLSKDDALKIISDGSNWRIV